MTTYGHILYQPHHQGVMLHGFGTGKRRCFSMTTVWLVIGLNAAGVFALHFIEKWHDVHVDWEIFKLGIMLQIGIALWKLFGILPDFL
ncbi:hypothetical protein NIIg97_gp23 [Geobacillus phage vB_GthS_NIIg9.7]|nr:hypothetical protein NIIg97_gp23 [Geobacillus phage vB_GthS_NIIg9.7]